jgi:flavin-binding protein dodecin
MTVARVTEISATSPDSFDDAVKVGIERANRTLRNVEGCWIKDMNVQVRDGTIQSYRVNMEVTFVLDD